MKEARHQDYMFYDPTVVKHSEQVNPQSGLVVVWGGGEGGGTGENGK